MISYRRSIAKWISNGLILWLCLVAQLMLLPRRMLFGANALPGAVAVLVIAVLFGPTGGAVCGFCAGLVMDAMLAHVEAYYTIFLCLAATVAGRVTEQLLQKTLWTAWLWCLVLLPVMQLGFFVLFYAMPGRAGPAALWQVALPEVGQSLVLVPPVYGLYRMVYARFREGRLGRP